MRSTPGPVKRTLFATLAIAQLALAVAGPLHEARAAADHGPVRIEQAQGQAGAPVDHADSCPICQYMAGHQLAPNGALPLVMGNDRPVLQPTGVGLLPARAPPTSHQTRAPPISLA